MARILGLILFLLGGVAVTFDAAAACSPTLSDTVFVTSCQTRWEAASAVDSVPSSGFCVAMYGAGHTNVKKDVTYAGASNERREVKCQGPTGTPKGGWIWSASFVDEGSCDAGDEIKDHVHITGVTSYSYPSMGPVCTQGCEYELIDSDVFCTDIHLPGASAPGSCDGYATWRSTGQTCTGDGPADPDIEIDDEPDNLCVVLPAGFKRCTKDPRQCVRDPDNKLVCPTPPGPDCDVTPKAAACIDRDPPKDYGPPIFDYSSCNGLGACQTIEVSGKDDDDDDDEECEPADPDCDEEEEEPDCPPNDPDCEDDDDDDAPRAADSGCETETPSCSDMGHVDCQILIRTHRTNCTVAYGNKMLEEFRDRQIEEVRETNAKLKALKETLNVNNASVLDVLQNKIALEVKQTNEKLRDLQATTGKVESAVRGTTAAVDSVGGKLDSQTLELGSKLDQIDGTLQGLDLGDVNIGDISVDNSDVVAAIEGGNSLLEGISDKLGDDVVGSIDGPSDSELGLTDDPGDDGGASWIEDVEIDVGELDATGWGWSRSCPSAPTAYVFGRAITFDVGPVCTWLGIGSHLVLLFAALASARIISRA